MTQIPPSQAIWRITRGRPADAILAIVTRVDCGVGKTDTRGYVQQERIKDRVSKRVVSLHQLHGTPST